MLSLPTDCPLVGRSEVVAQWGVVPGDMLVHLPGPLQGILAVRRSSRHASDGFACSLTRAPSWLMPPARSRTQHLLLGTPDPDWWWP